jgi:large subunit ribosomal protein L2
MSEKRKFKPLICRSKPKYGRSFGRICCLGRFRYLKRLYRFIDFRRIIFPGLLGLLNRKEYDPNRRVTVSLICNAIGTFTYILTPGKTKIGCLIYNQAKEPFNNGDSSILKNFPSGGLIHNISLYPKNIGQLIRSAGCFCILIRKETEQALLQLKSGELRHFNLTVTATLGCVGAEEAFLRNLLHAGTTHRQGKRPRVRPSAMNPVDHPMGGRTRGGSQPTNHKGIITNNRPTKKRHHPSILSTRRHTKVHHFAF